MSKKNKRMKYGKKKTKNNPKIKKDIVIQKREVKENNDIKVNENSKIEKDKNNKKINSIKKNKQKEEKKLNYNTLSIEDIEVELKKEKYKSKYFNILSSTVYGLIIVAALAAIIATLVMPVFQISGSSMSPVLDNGDLVISIKTKKIESGDMIAFYHGNKILVKRVIARSGQWVVMDEDGKVYVDGKVLEEDYVEELLLGDYDIKFPYQVPAESYFVLGDNRKVYTDSRNSEIGSIKEEDIIGKILFKLWDAKK